MVRVIPVFACCVVLILLACGCDTLQAVVPLPQPTVIPTSTNVINTPTPVPTLGELIPLNAVYCWQPRIEDDEYNLIRFFPSGIVLEVTVQGYANCGKAWEYIESYLVDTATDVFNHGEYQTDGQQVRFWLAPAGSNQKAGDLTGKFEQRDDGKKMILERQGGVVEYSLIYEGELP